MICFTERNNCRHWFGCAARCRRLYKFCNKLHFIFYPSPVSSHIFNFGIVNLICYVISDPHLLLLVPDHVITRPDDSHWILQPRIPGVNELTHWGQVTHICVNKLSIIGSDSGASPGRRQALIGTSAGILLIGPLGTNFGEILIEIYTFSFKKMHLKMSSGKWLPFCLGLNVLIYVVVLHCTHLNEFDRQRK